ncbi:MAG: hypothetical protein ACOYVF_01600 [Candidatus Zixiibacteriota bacterium]
MNKYLITLVCLFFIVACSKYDPQTPVYDTAKNPENFPDMAIALIDGIESATLTSYDTILASFAELYTRHNELLDDKNWSKVVERMGAKFRFRAEVSAAEGITGYYRAAELYALAAFAQPHDSALKETDRLFNVWKKEVLNSPLAARCDSLGTGVEFEQQLRLLRTFLFDDSLHFLFGHEYLVPSLLGQYISGTPLADSVMERLNLPDKAFLAWLEAYKEPITDKIIYYTEPVIDLVTAQILPLGGDWFTAELYFIPRDTVPIDYTVALRANMARDVLPSGEKMPKMKVMPFDFYPEKPSSQWEIDKIAVAFHKFYCPGPKGLFSVGLYQKGTNPFKFNPVWLSGFNFYTLPDTVLKLY